MPPPVPPTHTPRRPRVAVVVVLLLVGAVVAGLVGGPASAQDEGDGTATTVEGAATTVPGESTIVGADEEDPTQDEGVGVDEVPLDPTEVPHSATPGALSEEAARLVQAELSVARASAVKLGSGYAAARTRTIVLEAELDQIERSVTALAAIDRVAVRRVAAARRQFEARAIAATIRGSVDDYVPDVPTGDPNDLAAAQALLASVLDADQAALREYLVARAGTDAALLRTADRLVTTRAELTKAREQMVDARRANVSAQINLSVLAAGSDIIINGFVFPVGVPHTFGNSFGAPRMIGTEYAHSHQGTDILAPFGTPLVACERGIITQARQRCARRHHVLDEGRERDVLLLRPPQQLRRGDGQGQPGRARPDPGLRR